MSTDFKGTLSVTLAGSIFAANVAGDTELSKRLHDLSKGAQLLAQASSTMTIISGGFTINLNTGAKYEWPALPTRPPIAASST